MSIARTPRNTADAGPATHLLGMLGSPDTYITDMEAQGQREVVNSTTLPTEILHSTQADFEALGFTFGEPVPGDRLFRQATLPAGWSREGSDHAMWSYLVDERGIRRAAVFYKAAFYDRDAHLSLQNVGYMASTAALYDDGDPKMPDKWSLFNEDERAAFVRGLDGMDEQIREYRDVYGKYAPRLAALRELLAAQS